MSPDAMALAREEPSLLLGAISALVYSQVADSPVRVLGSANHGHGGEVSEGDFGFVSRQSAP
jgi:hypothetical protein